MGSDGWWWGGWEEWLGRRVVGKGSVGRSGGEEWWGRGDREGSGGLWWGRVVRSRKPEKCTHPSIKA